jgi:hypothetical protein
MFDAATYLYSVHKFVHLVLDPRTGRWPNWNKNVHPFFSSLKHTIASQVFSRHCIFEVQIVSVYN